jgi:hypothetical protein
LDVAIFLTLKAEPDLLGLEEIQREAWRDGSMRYSQRRVSNMVVDYKCDGWKEAT